MLQRPTLARIIVAVRASIVAAALPGARRYGSICGWFALTVKILGTDSTRPFILQCSN
jgi:hypothetical protein